MGWFIFWLIINCIVGYLIGKPKNNVGGAIALSIFLGPIGWLIAALSSGGLRKCPYCAEFIKPEAQICRYCHRDLAPIPQAQIQSFEPKSKAEWITVSILIGILALIIIVFICTNSFQ